jgi:hypothetical protein
MNISTKAGTEWDFFRHRRIIERKPTAEELKKLYSTKTCSCEETSKHQKQSNKLD